MFALARSRRLIPGTVGLFGILDMARELTGRRATITTVGFSFWMTMRPARRRFGRTRRRSARVL